MSKEKEEYRSLTKTSLQSTEGVSLLVKAVNDLDAITPDESDKKLDEKIAALEKENAELKFNSRAKDYRIRALKKYLLASLFCGYIGGSALALSFLPAAGGVTVLFGGMISVFIVSDAMGLKKFSEFFRPAAEQARNSVVSLKRMKEPRDD